jgi:D-tyrosyl-tRNA(Tyr) deacylase
MIIIAQRVSSSSVAVDGEIVGSINRGLMLLAGVHKDDDESSAEYLAAKCADLRIFPDDDGKMNLSLRDIGGEALVISQFTLLGNCSKGRRPNFTDAAPAEKGRRLYEYFVTKLKEHVRRVETGIFGADMKVQLVNDGPVTVIINS